MNGLKLVAGALVLAASSVAAQTDVFSTLGTTSQESENSIFASFTNGTVAVVGERSVFTTATPETRAALVRGVIAAARAYTATPDFADRYARYRQLQRPERENVPQTGDEALAEQQKQLEDAIREAQLASQQLSADAREKLAHNIAYMKQQLAELNADPDHRAAVDASVKEAARAADAEFARRNADFDAEYPADPPQLIARRLRKFLELSATVDFSAQLVEKDKRMRFADPSLEAKPREWKMLYRAGQPAVDAARAAAEDWLKALGV
jgi:hypothetical protein